MSIEIRPFGPDTRRAATALVDRVFPSQGPIERLSLRVLGTRLEGLLRLGGIRRPRFWVALEGDGPALGTVGLYEMGDGAAWLGWFCTAPEARGRGLGRRLLDFAIETAAREGYPALRLYTSTDPNEAGAQVLYERMGFDETGRRSPMLWRLFGSPIQIVHRERALRA